MGKHTKKPKIMKQTLRQYKYVCPKHSYTVYTHEPSVEACPVCEKRMELRGWPEPIKYPEEIKTDAQYRALKLSKLGKLAELKSILNKPDETA